MGFLRSVATTILVFAGLIASGCNRDHPDYLASVPRDASNTEHPVAIHPVETTPTVWIADGGTAKPSRIRCQSCHSTREPDLSNRSATDLTEFHQGLQYAHGDLTCLSCHSKNDYDRLGLADGRSIPFAEVMTLCGQCHGPQLRDYENGAHGGGTGYWDQSRGALQRNNCVHCHDPHSPAFRAMQPAFKARDRFLSPTESTHG